MASGGVVISAPQLGSTKQTVSLAERIATRIFPVRSRTQTPDEPRLSQDTIKVVCISDTHNTKPDIPPGDILLHAGDLSQYGTFDELQAQLDWLNALSHKIKVVIAGNHDLLLDREFVKAHPDRELDKAGKSRDDLRWGGIRYLENESVSVDCGDRNLTIYGSPMTPRCGNFAFQYDPREDIWHDALPADLDILLTHGPPAFRLDDRKGCKFLLEEIWSKRPALVVFGHIHSAHGQSVVAYSAAQRHFDAICVGERRWLHLLLLIFSVLSDRLQRVLGYVDMSHQTKFVNAASVRGRPHDGNNEPVIVYL